MTPPVGRAGWTGWRAWRASAPSGPLSGQTLEIEDDAIRGTQSVSFSPSDGGVAVALRLAYELKRRSPLMALVDVLFIRRAMARSLGHTLARFGAELEAARREGPQPPRELA